MGNNTLPACFKVWGVFLVSPSLSLSLSLYFCLVPWVEKLSYEIVCNVEYHSLVGYRCIRWCEVYCDGILMRSFIFTFCTLYFSQQVLCHMLILLH